MVIKYVLPVVALGLLAFAIWSVAGARQEGPPAAPPLEPPRSPYEAPVAGSGIIEPRTEDIEVGSPLPGVVVEVFVEEDQKVRAGDKLFRLDDRQELAELSARTAVVTAAQAELTRLEQQPRPEDVPVLQAAVDGAKATLADAQDQLRRVQPLVEKGIASQEELARAQQAVERASAELAQANAELARLNAGAWQYELEVARAEVARAQSQVDQVNIELGRLVVRAFVDAEVLQVDVRPGEFVGAPPGEPLIVLGDVELLHARVDIDEHDIPRFHPGAAAKAQLRGAPGVEFALTFVRVEPYVVPKISLTGDNTERVDTRVLQVIYAIDPGDRQLYVGQQLDVFIEAAEGSQP